MGVSSETTADFLNVLEAERQQLLATVDRLTRERDEAWKRVDAWKDQATTWERAWCEYRQALEKIAHLSDERDGSVWFSEAVDIARRAISTGEG